ncbi:hypothetical protein A3H16_01985 [Candidatus Kaiserbacteria bacterium RIFCSPLOWO2_12_FULL_53_8]|uniref:Maf-like protein n=2 Tax=Candidatus Kaiseribacteriota TaxID=1752734 RepID=A0A1F6CYJ2_9BACT|nr:MAG: hypothetical protein A2851_00985 [Candidatus Kaiserbacteria bacterium RIFCSPHIGHO2_01_FULL_53_29]OGG92362.1 MAG: hypothetical protein A3H16_01985 [Candidatus Kaiserbacteria bacterium RIFCSPLOWO2_12_FULL_53_8]
MKIIICGSISAADEILSAKKILEDTGHVVEVPEGVKNNELRARTDISNEEKANDKIAHDLIRKYFEKVKQCDVVLVVNPEKRGIKGYIGGNSLIEMAFAHVLGKPLYVLHPIPQLPYTAEIIAMQPVILNGDLSLI